jgi:hypothetical protein
MGDARLFEQMCACGLKSAEELARLGLTRELTVQNMGKFLAFNLPYKVVLIPGGSNVERQALQPKRGIDSCHGRQSANSGPNHAAPVTLYPL